MTEKHDELCENCGLTKDKHCDDGCCNFYAHSFDDSKKFKAKQETCENCGHVKSEHYKGHVYHRVGKAGVRIIKCKKFKAKIGYNSLKKAKNHSQPGQDVGRSQLPMESGKLLNPGAHTKEGTSKSK